jgi:hypothetical protein
VDAVVVAMCGSSMKQGAASKPNAGSNIDMDNQYGTDNQYESIWLVPTQMTRFSSLWDRSGSRQRCDSPKTTNVFSRFLGN